MKGEIPIRKAIALIDGEHYPDVVEDALSSLEANGYSILALVFLGGTEKVWDGVEASYGNFPLYSGEDPLLSLKEAIADHEVDEVIDLSDEPIAGYRERFKLISESLAMGVSYRGADFYFSSPNRPFICEKASIGIWGSGKRVGKTAISGYFARRLQDGGKRVCVCTMGRGGPKNPEFLGDPRQISDSYLRELSKLGRHAASDHFEDAMMGKVPTVGCRRCGGGMAGEPYFSNVAEGAKLACETESEIILFEGSGAAIPPVGTDAVLLVVSALQEEEYILEYLGRYRLLLSDLIVITMCEEFQVSSKKLSRLTDGIFSINPEVKIVKTVFRPRPLGDLRGKKIFLASTAPLEVVKLQGAYLESNYGARLVGVSSNLANRSMLARALQKSKGADVFVTELKAAGVDVVSSRAHEQSKELVYIENFPVALEGSLDEELDYLYDLAGSRFSKRKRS
ncbi:MAG: 2,3-diphosphoglycerate synthetase [Actinomycetota bacterium]|nr:2,3-diphosphoglycerate synthetase [Actinomycetota bacterium]